MLKLVAAGPYSHQHRACSTLCGVHCRRCGRAPDDISSIVLVEEGKHYMKSDAVLRIASRLGLPLPVVAAALTPLPHFVRDTFYDQVFVCVCLCVHACEWTGMSCPAAGAGHGLSRNQVEAQRVVLSWGGEGTWAFTRSLTCPHYSTYCQSTRCAMLRLV
jgi:hypothetical protein